jgi:hypothetical protein
MDEAGQKMEDGKQRTEDGMQNTEQRMQNIEQNKNNRPMAVLVFGIANLVIGIYSIVRMGISWTKVLPDLINNPKGYDLNAIFSLLIFIVSTGLVIWLIILGYGLLGMKRWARRGSVLYGWIQVVLIGISVGAIIVSTITGWPESLNNLRASITINNGLVMLQWLYMILLLVFMKTAKVKRAFGN